MTSYKSEHSLINPRFELLLDRHEAKFVLPPGMIPQIRDYIRPYCLPDKNGCGDPPSYTITTLQLDNPYYSLHYAKEHEALHRFKLRVRTYGTPGDSQVFIEIKRKLRGTIVKSRTRVPFELWNEKLILDITVPDIFKTDAEEVSFLQFKRLVRQLGARPVMLLRYERESYFGHADQYARITFDTRLRYQPTRHWNDWGESGRWRTFDTVAVQNKGMRQSGVVLELKTLSEAPQWMLDLVKDFELVRTGHCKYSNAVWEDSLFSRETYPPAYDEPWADGCDRRPCLEAPWMTL